MGSPDSSPPLDAAIPRPQKQLTVGKLIPFQDAFDRAKQEMPALAHLVLAQLTAQQRNIIALFLLRQDIGIEEYSFPGSGPAVLRESVPRP